MGDYIDNSPEMQARRDFDIAHAKRMQAAYKWEKEVSDLKAEIEWLRKHLSGMWTSYNYAAENMEEIGSYLRGKSRPWESGS